MWAICCPFGCFLPNDWLVSHLIGIVTQTVSGANLKTMNELFFTSMTSQQSNLSPADLLLVQTLAPLCPITEGVAVYIARNLLAKHTGEVEIYNSDCYTIMPKHKADKKRKDFFINILCFLYYIN